MTFSLIPRKKGRYKGTSSYCKNIWNKSTVTFLLCRYFPFSFCHVYGKNARFLNTFVQFLSKRQILPLSWTIVEMLGVNLNTYSGSPNYPNTLRILSTYLSHKMFWNFISIVTRLKSKNYQNIWAVNFCMYTVCVQRY